jgi:periplasmic divalent cation tolerance protein
MSGAGETVCFVYVTAADQNGAERLAETVVRERLAACANMLGALQSLYWWEGEVCRGDEVALVFKAARRNVDALTRRICELHPYDCPCVVALPAIGGNPAFLEWVAGESR